MNERRNSEFIVQPSASVDVEKIQDAIDAPIEASERYFFSHGTPEDREKTPEQEKTIALCLGMLHEVLCQKGFEWMHADAEISPQHIHVISDDDFEDFFSLNIGDAGLYMPLGHVYMPASTAADPVEFFSVLTHELVHVVSHQKIALSLYDMQLARRVLFQSATKNELAWLAHKEKKGATLGETHDLHVGVQQIDAGSGRVTGMALNEIATELLARDVRAVTLAKHKKSISREKRKEKRKSSLFVYKLEIFLFEEILDSVMIHIEKKLHDQHPQQTKEAFKQLLFEDAMGGGDLFLTTLGKLWPDAAKELRLLEPGIDNVYSAATRLRLTNVASYIEKYFPDEDVDEESNVTEPREL